jgi:hypothetical protein
MSSFSFCITHASVTALIFQVVRQSRVTSLIATSCRRRASLCRAARNTAVSTAASTSAVQPTISSRVQLSIRSIIGAQYGAAVVYETLMRGWGGLAAPRVGSTAK